MAAAIGDGVVLVEHLTCCHVLLLLLMAGGGLSPSCHCCCCSAFSNASPQLVAFRCRRRVKTTRNNDRNLRCPIHGSSKSLLWSSKTSNQDDDLELWTYKTRPFVAVRRFTPLEVSDQDILRVLDDNSITTMDELNQKGKPVTSQLMGDDITDFILAVCNACLRRTISIEEVLGGTFLYDASLIPKNGFESYTPGAVSVKPDTLVLYCKDKDDDDQDGGGGSKKDEFREPEISLVMGSSGSGKTLFALKGLPPLLFGLDGEKSFISVHIRASKAVGVANNSGMTFPQAVASIVQDEVSMELAKSSITTADNAQLFLHVVIDEAGAEAFQNLFDTAEKIRDICDAAKTMVTKPAFARGVHVTVVGTGLEQFTADIVSVKDVYKFRMQPWRAANFDALVDHANHFAQAQQIKHVVHNVSILEDLSSNARCAYFVMSSMRNLVYLRKNRLKNFVKVVVFKVADMYVANNELRDLITFSDQWKVARAVFKELDKATSQRGRPFFPRFDDLSQEKLRSVARSLLDVHVESEKGVPKFVDENAYSYSFSMSRALVIVLINLLSTDVDISWDWESFVMLSEFKEMIVKSQQIPTSRDRLIVQLRSPFPSTRRGEVFKVPLVGGCTVLLNGPRASYADVISPYRLAQAKFSIFDDKPANLTIQKELDKMGVTYSSGNERQQNVTKILHMMWKRGDPNPVRQMVVVDCASPPNKLTKGDDEDYRFKCNPMNTLNSRQVQEEPKYVVGSLENGALVAKGEGITQEDEIPEDFDESHPLTVVFATNCNGFRLVGNNFTFWPSNVDIDGRLLLPFPMGAVSGLRSNVQLRFQFF